jgi:hypothetical protein
MNDGVKLMGLVVVAAAAACAPIDDPGGAVPGARALAREAAASARRCARDLEELSATNPEAAWSGLEPWLELPGQPAGDARARQRLARRDRDEVLRRLQEVESLQRVVTQLADQPGVETYLDLPGLAERSRQLSSRLCRSKDLASARMLTTPPGPPARWDASRALAGVPPHQGP